MTCPAPVLRAGDLTVRRYRPEDVAALHEAIVASLDHLRPWMPWVAFEPLTLEQRAALVGRFDGLWDDGTDFNYGVFDGDEVVGGCGLHRRIGPDGLEIGYWVRAGRTGRGIATAAAGALAEAALGLDGVTHVEIHHDKANVASARVPAKLGFTFVGESPDEVAAPAEVGISCSWRRDRPF